jgi:phosphate transport system protein
VSNTTEKKRPLLTVEKKVLELFALVTDGITGATEALLSGDKNQVKELVSREKMIDELYSEVEQLILHRISTLDLPSRRLHELITILRMLPEIERSGDLAEHIAWRASRRIGLEVSPRARGIIQRMCEILFKMWTSLSEAFELYDAKISTALDELDDELDELHVSLTAEIVSANLAIPIAIEVAMVGRFYERLGDHCVNLAKRVTYLASNQPEIFQ